jgi:cold shock CspA family protein
LIGLVLWHNPEAGVGVIWCEDQGPLAFLGPDVVLPDGVETMHPGDEVNLRLQVKDGVRYVREIRSFRLGKPGADPRAILAAAQAAPQGASQGADLKIVA